MSGYNGNPIQQISSALSSYQSNPNTHGGYSVGPTTQFNFPQSLADNANAVVSRAQTEIRGITPTIPSGSNTGSTMGYVGKAVDLIGGFMPERDEYQGTYGDITQTMDSVYDATADALMAIPGWGCVCAGTRVIDNQGRFVNIEDLKQEDGIIGWNNGQINKEKIIAFIDPHEKECLEIKLQSGNIIRCSIDHPILCSKGWSKEIKIEGKRKNIKVYKFIRADNIKVGDNLGIANEINIWGNLQMENPYLIGMLIGDGSYGKDHGARLYSTDLDTWNYIEKNQLGGKINYDCSRYSSEFRCYRIYNGAQQLKALGIYEQTGQNKTLPKDIYKYDKESVCDLLAGLFDTDGCVFYSEEKGEYKIYLDQSNLNLLKEVSEQLLKLGIHSSIQVSKEKTSIISNRIINSKKSYRLIIKDKYSVINFYNNIKLNISYKKQNLEKLYIYIQNIYSKDNRYVAGAKADKVVEINNIGLQIIYNLQADDDHTYLANGIITHNTIAGGAMKVAGVLGDAVGSLGGSTDGMCVCTGTKVFKANGEIVNIEDLKQEDGIIGWNEETKQIVPQTIRNIIEPRQKECLEITIKSGFILRCSVDHPILSDNSPKAKSHRVNGQYIAYRDWKFRRADELKVGDFIGVANNIDYWGNTTLDKAYLIGLLIGDGTYTKGNSCRLISADKSTWDYIESNGLGVINHCDDSRPDKYNTEVRTYRIIDGMDLMRQVGLVYQSGENKTLPKNIGQYTKDSICQLLAGLYDTDGSISVNENKNNWSITLYQSNKNLLQEVKEQLHKLGIFASISARKAAKYQLGGKIINSNQSYRLSIINIASAIKFTQLIPLNIDYKKANLARIYNLLKDKKAQEHSELSGAKQFKIVDIKPIGLQTVYNLQADNDHTYLANGIITHNTTVDSVLGSSFFNLTPFGLINGFGGKTTDTITKDEQSFEQVGASYGGTSATVDDALTKSGKKYGLFSRGAMNDANQEIAEAKRQQAIMGNISDIAADRRVLSQNMAAINGNRRAYQLQGGYQQQNIRVGKHGMNIDLVNRTKEILSYTEIEPTTPQLLSKFKEGGQINKKSRTLQELIEYAKRENPRFIQRLSEPPRGIDFIDDKGNQVRGSHYMEWSTDSNGNAIIYPRIQEVRGELKFFSGPDAYKRAIENKNYLIMTPEEVEIFFAKDPKYGTAYKSGWPQFFDKFQQGGSINVIPDGALHARKHNMDMDGITKKGIPVVSENKDGEIEQQAEIEKEEIILRLEVTQKLEKLAKEGTEEAALEAGKLLVEEILYNTDDKANLINRV